MGGLFRLRRTRPAFKGYKIILKYANALARLSKHPLNMVNLSHARVAHLLQASTLNPK